MKFTSTKTALFEKHDGKYLRIGRHDGETYSAIIQYDHLFGQGTTALSAMKDLQKQIREKMDAINKELEELIKQEEN